MAAVHYRTSQKISYAVVFPLPNQIGYAVVSQSALLLVSTAADFVRSYADQTKSRTQLTVPYLIHLTNPGKASNDALSGSFILMRRESLSLTFSVFW